ncbi:acyl-CoA synthetase [Zavarzinia sp. CC-PAN008]|uniref:acyl-CoA synthetase n=1 Tax=Zavarzinia sp. CC-PAN008 TaxID=3243332 RepID=UPI003F744525
MAAWVRSGNRVIANADLADRAARAGSGFESLGIGAGDVVAIFLRNDFAFLEASVAAGLVGAYVTPVNWHNSADEAAYVFQNSGAKAIVIHADLYRKIQAAVPAGIPVFVVPTPPELAAAYNVAAADCAVPPGMTDFYKWLAPFPPKLTGPAEPPGSMIYTSGTTGHPKGVRRQPPNEAQAAAGQRMMAKIFGMAGFEDRMDQVVAMAGAPMYHSTPNGWTGAFFRNAANMVLMPRFDAETMLANIEKYRVTHLLAVPTMFVRLLKLPEDVRRKYDVSSLRFVMHGAAPCPVAVKHAMIEWWGPIIDEHYGGTETGAITYATAQEWLAHPGTVGRAMEGATVRVIDAEGRECETGAVGEVIGRMADYADFTYHGDDAKRARAEKQGLISLGDIGYLDGDGFLYLSSRSSDIIISGGVNIYPAEIEAELLKMPGVADCAVFGIPDDEMGEQVCAIVQPQGGSSLTIDGIKAHLRERVAGYKVPRHVEIRDTLPREDSGKIFKRKIREPFWEGLDRRI